MHVKRINNILSVKGILCEGYAPSLPCILQAILYYIPFRRKLQPISPREMVGFFKQPCKKRKNAKGVLRFSRPWSPAEGKKGESFRKNVRILRQTERKRGIFDGTEQRTDMENLYNFMHGIGRKDIYRRSEKGETSAPKRKHPACGGRPRRDVCE